MKSDQTQKELEDINRRLKELKELADKTNPPYPFLPPPWYPEPWYPRPWYPHWQHRREYEVWCDGTTNATIGIDPGMVC